MYEWPRGYPENLSFEEAEETLISVNEALKEQYDSDNFIVQWDDGDITFEFDEDGFY